MSGYFIFDDIDTRTYQNIYVYFDEVDTTPKRVYETVEVAGRNGSLYIDQGRYEDVPHTYHIVALTKDAGSNLINALASKVGYYRLEDSFNPTEYYSAVFTPTVEPKITSTRDVNTFKITFTRKPQRWLKTGETAVTVANSGTLTNPTLQASSPLLEVEGYGTIGFNGYEIEIASVDIGDIELTKSKNGNVYTLGNMTDLNNGDTITVASLKCTANAQYGSSSFHGYRTLTASGIDGASVTARALDKTIGVELTFPSEFTLTYGTSKTMTETVAVVVRTTPDMTATFTISLAYNGSNTITMSASVSSSPSRDHLSFTHTLGNVTAYSTKPYNFGSIFVDCDLGEFYRLENGVPISMNHVGDLGSDLPKLAPGSNTFTKDNTITQLKVTPRWWKV